MKNKIKENINLMKETDQLSGKQTILEHGISVSKQYLTLISLLKKIASGDVIISDEFLLPEILYNKDSAQFILDRMKLSIKTMRKYLVFHDVGKPYCIKIDPDG